MELIREVIDEIALNGLEGTTIPGLWKQLSEKKPPILNEDDDYMKDFIWNGIIQCKQIEFWFVNKERSNVKSDKNSKKKPKSENGKVKVIFNTS